MFELKEKDGWVLEWKGCVNVDGKYYFNDVSLDETGSFYATHMFDPDISLARVVWNVFVKSDTGMAIKWSQENNFEELQVYSYLVGTGPCLAYPQIQVSIKKLK